MRRQRMSWAAGITWLVLGGVWLSGLQAQEKTDTTKEKKAAKAASSQESSGTPDQKKKSVVDPVKAKTAAADTGGAVKAAPKKEKAGKEEAAKEDAAKEEIEPSVKLGPEQARAAFESKFADWKEALKRLRTMRHDYQEADETERTALELAWKQEIQKISQFMVNEVGPAGAAAFAAAPNEDRELTRFLVQLLQDEVDHDQYGPAMVIGNALVDNRCDMPILPIKVGEQTRQINIYGALGTCCFSMHEFGRALAVLQAAELANAESGDAAQMKKDLEQYQGYWKKEQEIRKKEAADDDLPRVKMTTSKGVIVIELFENEAPETVGNFVSLVKSGFYDGLTFHRVLAGFMAQGGDPEGNGSGGPGYTIYDEFAKPDARIHFRGSLSMAKTGAPDSGGSQFFLTFRPTPFLNGKHTVFGRVIEGIDVAVSLQRIDPEDQTTQVEPDRIVKAEMLRDRGHEYLPHKVDQ